MNPHPTLITLKIFYNIKSEYSLYCTNCNFSLPLHLLSQIGNKLRLSFQSESSVSGTELRDR